MSVTLPQRQRSALEGSVDAHAHLLLPPEVESARSLAGCHPEPSLGSASAFPTVPAVVLHCFRSSVRCRDCKKRLTSPSRKNQTPTLARSSETEHTARLSHRNAKSFRSQHDSLVRHGVFALKQNKNTTRLAAHTGKIARFTRLLKKKKFKFCSRLQRKAPPGPPHAAVFLRASSSADTRCCRTATRLSICCSRA